MIEITLRFFAGQRDIVGRADLVRMVEPDSTVGNLWERLLADYPGLQPYTGHIFYAVNQQFSDPSTLLHDGDEVAFIPPVSGGITDEPEPFVITADPLATEPLIHLVQTPADGAVVTFAGVVRNNLNGRATAYLTYEAYTEMALSVLRQIGAEAQARYPIGRVAVHHRVGRLEIGETAVLVVAAAPHRQAALEAVGYMMDRIKQIVPIWKCEHWADGTNDWRDSSQNIATDGK